MSLPVVIALVDDTHSIAPARLASVAGAMQEQVNRDFRPRWRFVPSTGVVATPSPSPAQWAVHIQQHLDQPGALGYHSNDSHNQPVAFVAKTVDWPQTFSHEVLEMLADPYGNRLHGARLPDAVALDYKKFGLPTRKHHVHYLLEACDPCERTSYNVGGEDLSDFLMPEWYVTTPPMGSVFSYAGGCNGARQVADGGYVSFSNDDGEWYQIFNEGGQLQIQDIGKFDKSRFGSLREFTDHHARERREDIRLHG
jgi:hypothetical protein